MGALNVKPAVNRLVQSILRDFRQKKPLTLPKG
jgi:hypothetical protein